MCDEVKFSVMSSLFSWMQRSKSAAKKRSKFRKFLDHFCKPGDYFGAIRLILPSLDRERGSYGLKESVLATCLIDALGMARDSEDAVRLINWRKGGAAKAGANAGNFAAVATEVLQRRQGMTSGGLTIRELNELLDRLASSENRAEKTSVLGEMIRKTNAQEMKWIVMIILKDLKLGVSEKSIFHEFHPDAEDLFNVTCDLKLVCEKLSDRSQRHKRQDIEVGKAVRPQLAMRVGNAAAAWKKLHGKEVVLECKFDGDRIQIHKNGSEIHFFSRNFFDHPEYEHGMSSLILDNVLVDRCILDGEMLVWDTSMDRFAEFGSNQEIAKAARDGLQSDRQLCYVAFDVLYVGDTSVIHQSLKERHELLKKVVRPLKGRLEILVPNGGLNKDRAPGEPCWSLIAQNVGDVEKFFKETIENRDEGIVLKDLGSKWEPSDRSGKWLKLKPEYIRAGSDLDVLIIGGYYGSGRHGGEVAQFLVGLAEKAAPNIYPRRFISFCRVGTGLSNEELDELVSKLKPYFRKYEYPKKQAPSFYQVTNNSKERPDVWIENPEKSIILAITSDIRMIRSEVFAAPYSLRFPRIDRVRYDKPWHECLDVQSFVELVQSSNGTTQRTADYETLHVQKSKRQKSTKREKNKLSLVPSHFIQTDISKVKGETSIFSDLVFYFVNVPRTYSLEKLHKMVIENGGSISMNLSAAVTHCIAAESKGIKYEAAKRRGDVIHYSWFLDCCSQNKLIHLQPKYFLFLSDSTKRKLQDEIDEFFDSYYWDISVDELKQILASVKGSEDIERIEHYRKKYCPSNKWCFLSGCCIQFHLVVPFCSKDWEDVLKRTMRRLRVEVTVSGGKVSQKPSQATHLVVLAVPGFERDFDIFLESFPPEDERFLHKKGLFIVQSNWLEDCFGQEQKLPEVEYDIKPDDFEVSTMEDEDDERNVTESSASLNQEEPQSSGLRRLEEIPHGKGKRGRPSRLGNTTRKRQAPITPPRRTSRPRIKKRSAKIEEMNEVETGSLELDDMAGRDEVKKPPPKLEGDEFERGSGSADDMVDREEEVTTRDHDLRHQTISLEEPEGVKSSKDRDMFETFDDWRARNERDRGVDVQMGEEDSIKLAHSNVPKDRDDDGMGKLLSGKSEMVDDPIQAMLLHLIPSLGTQRGVEEGKKSSPIKKHAEETMQADTTKAESSSVGEAVKQEPVVKKKKVSYKDVASELLKDW